jgi:replicative DNA helicase
MVKDYPQAQAVEFEELVLGSMLQEANCIDTVLNIPLLADHFYLPEHKKIYNAILSLYQKNEPTHIVAVSRQLKVSGELTDIGGPLYLTKLTGRVGSTEGIEYHCRIIIQQYLRREGHIISLTSVSQFNDNGNDIFEVIEKVQQSLFDLVAKTLRKSYNRLSESIGAAISAIEKNNGTALTGVKTGFADLDKEIYGWQKSDLIILAARPGMGKTSFVLSSAIETAKAGTPVAFFSLEMSEDQLVNKVLSCESEIPLADIRQQKMTPEQIAKLKAMKAPLEQLPLYIDETPALSVFEFRAKARRMKQVHGIQLIIIDYLQLMTAKGYQNREAEISFISRSLKQVAKELNVPVIALSQMSRKVEERAKTNNRPQLSDLRESGAIEQDADIVIFVYRPEYYKQFKDDGGNDLKGVAELIIAKHRNGSLTSVYLKFIGYLTKFANLDNSKFAPSNVDFQHTPIEEEF